MPYLPRGFFQSRPLPAPGPLAHSLKFRATPPMMNLGVSVANRVSRHQPSPPSMSEYAFSGFGPSYWANIQVPNSPLWNSCPG